MEEVEENAGVGYKLRQIREYVNDPKRTRLVSILGLLVITITLPVTLLLVQREQDIRQRAQEVSLTPPFPPTATPTPMLDTDSDGWVDTAETYIGTDPLDACADNKADAAWPPDFNNDRAVNNKDADLIKRVYIARLSGTPVPTQYKKRGDLNTDGSLTQADVALFQSNAGKTCVN